MELKNVETQVQMEREDLEQEKINLKQLHQELDEIEQENEEEKNILDEESYSLIKLQSKLYENFNDIHEDAYDLNKTETLCLKQDSILMLKERMLKRVMERKQRLLRPITTQNLEERKSGFIDIRNDITAKSGSIVNKEEQMDYMQDSVNVSGHIPSSRVITILKKEQEVEEQVKALNEKKEKLKQMQQLIEHEKAIIETMQAQLKREAAYDEGKQEVISNKKKEKRDEISDDSPDDSSDEQTIMKNGKEVDKREKYKYAIRIPPKQN